MKIILSKLSCIVFVVCMFAGANAFAQKEKAATPTMTYVDANAVLKKVYTKEELELLGKNDTIAFGTAFSLALLLENSASLHYISKDTLFGNRTAGTIFFPSTFKSRDFVLVRRR